MDARHLSLLATLLLLAANAPPGASAASTGVGLGIDSAGAPESVAAGAVPAYETFWVGHWTLTSGWGALDDMLATARAHGSTPLVLFYYWGNSISPDCVSNGCNGRSRAEWSAMAATLASHLRSMGGAASNVVVENEFNKNDITGTYAPTFDTYLADITKTLKTTSGVRAIVGFGAWGEASWGAFPKTIAASDDIGFQLMRASTRSNESDYRRAPDDIAAEVAAAHAVAPTKKSFLYDLALASYPDARWASVQSATLSDILSRRAEYASAGLAGIAYRGVRDAPDANTQDWYGLAETSWGLKTATGVAKPAWSVWTHPPEPATFVTPHGNAWWIETGVSAAQPPASVCASVDGGACQPLTLRWWGRWAASIHAPEGSSVTFSATSPGGTTTRSAAYLWPGGAPASAFNATFSGFVGNAWWVQTSVRAGPPVASVCASVDGGACQPLALKSYGWAASLHAPAGSSVRFTATSTTGAKTTSAAVAWPPR